jgi:hypothetical protein
MYRNVWMGLALLLGPAWAGAQSVSISPATPHGGEAIAVQFTESFDCTAPTPSLKTQQGNTLTYESVLPYGIVECAVIPFPMPEYSNFSADLGPLAAGNYHLTWNMYRAQSDGSQTFLWTVSKDFSVAAPQVVSGAAVATTPALQPLALLLLAASLGALALRRRRLI